MVREGRIFLVGVDRTSNRLVAVLSKGGNVATLKKPAKKNSRNQTRGARPSSLASVKYLFSEEDNRISSRYVMFSISVAEYLELVQTSYEHQGQIDGQRTMVKTASATRIRQRMADDLIRGAVIPPLVLGVRSHEKGPWNDAKTKTLLSKLKPESISIIDGMQRTTVLIDNKAKLRTAHVRVELWLAPSTSALVYRMLVLNTGQVPWNLRRQMEVIHQALIEELTSLLKDQISIYKTDDSRRRTQAGEFQAHDVIEMYLAFNLRRANVDKEAVLADQFNRLDFLESVSQSQSVDKFISAIKLMLALDHQISSAFHRDLDEFETGRRIFDKLQACTGFMAAYSQFVRGRVGMERSAEVQKRKSKEAETAVAGVLLRMRTMSPTRVADYLALATLDEVYQRRAGPLSIGEYQRELFTKAFLVMFEEGAELASFEPCWRSQ